VINSLKITNVGPISNADIEFGDLTVFVGPQACGKSICSQFLKLIQDTGFIKNELETFGFDWKNEWSRFLQIYFGEGMNSIWKEDSKIIYDNESFDETRLKKARMPRQAEIKNFYIPAQRTTTIENGWLKPFNGFDSSFPYVLKSFSENIRQTMDKSFIKDSSTIFPQDNILKKGLREIIEKNIYRNSRMVIKEISNRKAVFLEIGDSKNHISFGSWSTGQREFAPLLFGLYWALPSSKTTVKSGIDTIVIEELEMGLHPKAIIAIMSLIIELLNRGYKVVLSTHSNIVLDVMWAINTIKGHKNSENRILEIFGIENLYNKKKWAKKCLEKIYKIYYFEKTENGETKFNTKDISSLDPGNDDPDLAGWGGLSGESGRIADIVSTVFDTAE
jgi:predicted ATPase